MGVQHSISYLLSDVPKGQTRRPRVSPSMVVFAECCHSRIGAMLYQSRLSQSNSCWLPDRGGCCLLSLVASTVLRFPCCIYAVIAASASSQSIHLMLALSAFHEYPNSKHLSCSNDCSISNPPNKRTLIEYEGSR